MLFSLKICQTQTININDPLCLNIRQTGIRECYGILPNSGLISVPGKIVPPTMLAHVPTERGPFQILYTLLHLHLAYEPVNRIWQSNTEICFMYNWSLSTINLLHVE